MTSNLSNRIEGTVDDLKGRSKVAAGDLTGNEELKEEGRDDRATGAVKKTVADVKDKIDEVVKKVTDK